MNPRISKRLGIEISQVKKKYPIAIYSPEEQSLIVSVASLVRPGKAITLHLSFEDYPYKAPKITIEGYNNSVLADWNPENKLLDYISNILKDVHNAESDPNFARQGYWENGKIITLRDPKIRIQSKMCEICSVTTQVMCSCCKTPLCSTICQKELHTNLIDNQATDDLIANVNRGTAENKYRNLKMAYDALIQDMRRYKNSFWGGSSSIRESIRSWLRVANMLYEQEEMRREGFKGQILHLITEMEEKDIKKYL